MSDKIDVETLKKDIDRCKAADEELLLVKTSTLESALRQQQAEIESLLENQCNPCGYRKKYYDALGANDALQAENGELRQSIEDWRKLDGTHRAIESKLRARVAELETAYFAARKFIELSPCDPDIYDDQAKAYIEWIELDKKMPSTPPEQADE